MTTNHEEPLEIPAPDPAPWSSGTPLHDDLLAAKERVYDPCGFRCSRPVAEAESAEYGAYGFTLDGASVRFRAARTTPKKAGQFVTLWKRSGEGPIRPFDVEDGVDLVVISTREGGHFGQFVFPREVLCERDIMSRDGRGGKRGFRVYPPWATTTNRQAGRTQTWQLDHFLPVGEDGPLDIGRARVLYRP
ncbi:MepB family protein [Streptomyces sp. NBC_01433]|uniref:MepB family protein n=1 Tax=Streptomyces sp. NBC_01433 TaxID=2903864 RepID=UPI002254CAEB|nr:MepB family protein [Streptomyces sp. NBC_01433]MCX4676551.1 MepB family protein [Streptomyces sp. NBC_01433]